MLRGNGALNIFPEPYVEHLSMTSDFVAKFFADAWKNVVGHRLSD
jgi:hypothetical protein